MDRDCVFYRAGCRISEVLEFAKAKEKQEQEDSASQLFGSLNKELFSKIKVIVEDLQKGMVGRPVVLDDVMGSGITDFVVASILMYNSCYFLNKLVGHDLKNPYNIKFQFKEIEQLALLCAQRFLRIEKDRFETHMVSELTDLELFRRLKKKAKENDEKEPPP